jgi:hypothetical protein
MTRYDILALRYKLIAAYPDAADDIDALALHALVGRAVQDVLQDHAGSRAVTLFLDTVLAATPRDSLLGGIATAALEALRDAPLNRYDRAST